MYALRIVLQWRVIKMWRLKRVCQKPALIITLILLSQYHTSGPLSYSVANNPVWQTQPPTFQSLGKGFFKPLLQSGATTENSNGEAFSRGEWEFFLRIHTENLTCLCPRERFYITGRQTEYLPKIETKHLSCFPNNIWSYAKYITIDYFKTTDFFFSSVNESYFICSV